MTSPVAGVVAGRREVAPTGRRSAARPSVVAPSVGRRRVPTAVWVVAAVFAVLFTAATIQSYLITGQRTLDRLQKQINDAKLQQDDLRRKEIDLRSPAQVAQTAMNDLKMVHAAPPVLLTPEPRVIGSATPQTTVPTPAPSPDPAAAAAGVGGGQ